MHGSTVKHHAPRTETAPPIRPRARLLACLATAVVAAACGPTCLETVSALDESAALAGDVARVNELVERRRAAMEDAEGGDHDAFAMQRLKFSVTAFELAAEAQLRVIKASPKYEDAGVYEEQRALVDELRCAVEELLEDDGHLVSDSDGRRLQRLHARLDRAFRDAGTLTRSELRGYLADGIPVEPSAAEPAGDAAGDAEEDAAPAPADDPAVYSEEKDDAFDDLL